MQEEIAEKNVFSTSCVQKGVIDRPVNLLNQILNEKDR